jgi:hypothetical protein
VARGLAVYGYRAFVANAQLKAELNLARIEPQPRFSSLAKWQVKDLTFPFTITAQFGQQENIVNGLAERHKPAYFDHAWQASAGLHTVLGMTCDGRHVVGQ